MTAADGTGLVIAAHGRRGVLELADGSKLPFLVPTRRLAVCCGDHVHWAPDDRGNGAFVTAIQPRRNELRRQPPRGAQPEVLAANLSHLLVLVAPVPAPDFFLADRYLCAAELMDCEAGLVLNKADLPLPTLPELAVYAAIGYPVIRCSGRSGTGLAELVAWLGTGTGILAGQSGVGKSSLLNALAPGAAAATGHVSSATGEGRHTTTASTLHRLRTGGVLIDTPGVRDFVPAVPSVRQVMVGFREISRAAAGCHFADCLHVREPDCAVQGALAAGHIDGRRYESYRRLLNLARQVDRRARP